MKILNHLRKHQVELTIENTPYNWKIAEPVPEGYVLMSEAVPAEVVTEMRFKLKDLGYHLCEIMHDHVRGGTWYEVGRMLRRLTPEQARELALKVFGKRSVPCDEYGPCAPPQGGNE